MAQEKGLGTTLCVHNCAAEASEAEELCLVAVRPVPEHWKLHLHLLSSHRFSEPIPDFRAQ